MEDKYYPEFCYGDDFCGESKCTNVDQKTYNGCKECLRKRITESQEFLEQLEEITILKECETNAKARDKLLGFILQLKQFKESDLLKMQAYLKRLYVEEKDLKINEIIGEMNALVRYVKGFLYGTK